VRLLRKVSQEDVAVCVSFICNFCYTIWSVKVVYLLYMPDLNVTQLTRMSNK